MLLEPVLDRQVGTQPEDAFLGVLEWHCVGPFRAWGLDSAFGFSVGAGRFGPGVDVPEAKFSARPCKGLIDLRRAVLAPHLP